MSITLLIAAGVIAGVSGRRVRRRHENNRSWLTASTPVGRSPVIPPSATGSQREIGPGFLALDRLEQIAGFEPLYARRLNQFGILTYGEMAGLSPAALQSMVAPKWTFQPVH